MISFILYGDKADFKLKTSPNAVILVRRYSSNGYAVILVRRYSSNG
jgi:hypothetical protein